MNMVEITLQPPSSILVTGATSRHGASITNIPNREFIKRGNRWIVPLSRLTDIIRIVGLQHVSLDYDVLRARDQQLERMITQYAQRGIRIWFNGDTLMTDNESLTAHLRPMATLLRPYAPDYMPERILQPSAPVTEVVEPKERPQAGGVQLSMESWLVGAQNAAKNAERESYKKGKPRWKKTSF